MCFRSLFIFNHGVWYQLNHNLRSSICKKRFSDTHWICKVSCKKNCCLDISNCENTTIVWIHCKTHLELSVWDIYLTYKSERALFGYIILLELGSRMANELEKHFIVSIKRSISERTQEVSVVKYWADIGNNYSVQVYHYILVIITIVSDIILIVNIHNAQNALYYHIQGGGASVAQW